MGSSCDHVIQINNNGDTAGMLTYDSKKHILRYKNYNNILREIKVSKIEIDEKQRRLRIIWKDRPEYPKDIIDVKIAEIRDNDTFFQFLWGMTQDRKCGCEVESVDGNCNFHNWKF